MIKCVLDYHSVTTYSNLASSHLANSVVALVTIYLSLQRMPPNFPYHTMNPMLFNLTTMNPDPDAICVGKTHPSTYNVYTLDLI